MRTDEEEEGRPRVGVGGRSNAVVYARVGLSYIVTAKLLHLQGGSHVPQTLFTILNMNYIRNNEINLCRSYVRSAMQSEAKFERIRHQRDDAASRFNIYIVPLALPLCPRPRGAGFPPQHSTHPLR